MAKFRTSFWSLLSEKELKEGQRYNNLTDLSKEIGVSRVTLYKYADEELNSIDADTVSSFMGFFGLSDEQLGKFLIFGNFPQFHAQETHADDLNLQPA